MSAWKQIGCAVDFSAHSWAALQRAAELARRLEAQLILVHVIPSGQPGVRAQAERAPGAAEERILGQLDEWRAAADHIAGGRAQAQLLVGSPAAELTRFGARGLDLLVVGTRGPTGLGRLLLGSVAERVARDAPCPVMVVHQREEAAQGLAPD